MVKPKSHRPKLPVQQLAILAGARFAEPLALSSVFPYLPEMIQSFGVEKNQVAKWAGITGSMFSLSQSLTAVPWGRLSDRIGRKPVILMGLTSTMICFIIWGMSTSLAMAITIRAIMGGGNGNVGIIRTMVAEMVPEKELQPRAFSVMPLVWSIGSVFGPSFGGFFAQPAKQYPNLFGDNEFLKKYPFALPNIIACVVFFLSFLTGLLFLKETLESKRHSRDWGLVLGEKLTSRFHGKKHRRRHGPSFCDDEAQAPLLAHSRASSSERVGMASTGSETTNRVFTPQTTLNLLVYTLLAFHSVAFDQILPVFLNYPKWNPDRSDFQLPFKFVGGFGLSSGKIGTIFTVYGIACGLVQFFIFPPLCSRYGVLNCFKVASLFFPVVYLLIPYTALIQDDRLRYVFFLLLLFIKGCVVIISFPCTTILLTNSTSSVRVLGTVNGFATTFSGLGRAAGPALTGAVFSLGVQEGYVVFPWWLLAFAALVGAVPLWWVVEGEGPHRSLDTDDDDDDDDDEEAIEEDDTLPSSGNGTNEDGKVAEAPPIVVFKTGATSRRTPYGTS